MINNFNLEELRHHSDAVDMMNDFLKGIESEIRVSHWDVECYVNKNWRTTNFQLALRDMGNVGVKPMLRSPAIAAAAGGLRGAAVASQGMAAGIRIRPQTVIRFVRNVARGVRASRAASKILASDDPPLQKAEDILKTIREETAKVDDVTDFGSSTGGGDRTRFSVSSSGGANYMHTQIPTIESNRVVEVANTLYPQMTVIPQEYSETLAHRDPESAYLASVQWVVPPATEYAGYFWKNWVQRFQLLAQMRCGFNVDASNKFSSDNMISYVNKISVAISTYLFYANTYQFTVLEGRNEARNALRGMFDTEDLQYLVLLKERLDMLPIPPRLYNELAHLYAIYHTSGASPSSCTYSFTPMMLGSRSDDLDSIPTDIDIQGIRYCLSDNVLNDDTFLTVTDMLARVLPEWVEVTVGSSQRTAHMHDLDHLNVFTNSPGVSSAPEIADTTTRYTPSYTGTDSEEDMHYIAFNDHGRNVRGDQQALWSALASEAIGENWSGFLVPVTSALSDGTSNRFKFTKGAGGNEKWVMDNSYTGNLTTTAGSSVFANTFDNATIQTAVPVGSYRLLGMSTTSQRVPQDQYLSFILDINFDSQANKGFSGKRKGRRGK